jgi:DNA replication and repair protein RecF
MYIRRLALKNFRNVQDAEFRPEPGLNFLVGSNGQGKTSWLEAIGLLGSLRSFRGSRTEELLKWDTPEGGVEAETYSGPLENPWLTQLKVTLVKTPLGQHQRTAWINSKSYRSGTHYLSQRFGSAELGFHTIVFNPSDHELIRGEPSARRKVLDQVLAAESLEYLEHLKRFHRVLEQRNSLLKQEGPIDRNLLTGFTEQLLPLSAWIVHARLDWLKRMGNPLQEAAHKIAPSQPPLGLFYEGTFLDPRERFQRLFAGQEEVPSLHILEQSLMARTREVEARELRVGTTLVGPHRDDWGIVIGGRDLKGHGSQGEVRTALLALKLSEIDLFRKKTGHRPVLLLDDFSSELDRERRLFLLNFLNETDLQVFVTTTEDAGYPGQVFHVVEGRVTRGNEQYGTRTVSDSAKQSIDSSTTPSSDPGRDERREIHV